MHPIEHILGVPPSADPARVLGLDPGPVDRVAVEAALEARIRETFDHPDGRSTDGDAARQVIRAAAARLIESLRETTPRVQLRTIRSDPAVYGARPAPSVAPPLTEFDRYVLATLVGGGGWNAESRARLVALADSYGVSATGLFRVMQGLADFAATGRHRIDVREITSGAMRVPAPARPTTTITVAASDDPAGADAPGLRSPERLGEQIEPDALIGDALPTVKLSILFGAITTLVFVLFLRVIWPAGAPDVPPPPDPPVASTQKTPVPPTTTTAVSPPTAKTGRLAIFRPAPTFLGNALPPAATDGADRCPQVPAEIDVITRKLSITDDPAEVIFRQWSDSVAAIGAGWVLADGSTRKAVAVAMDEALHEAADTVEISDRLLEALRPPRLPGAAPIDLWRGAWQAGTLATIGASRVLPPVVVERARDVLAYAVDHEPDRRPATFEDGADAWLARAAEALAERTELEPRTYDFWEAWLSAQRELGTGARYDQRLVDAIGHVLARDTDLSRPGPSTNVLGRLLTISDFTSSAVVKDGVREIFDDREQYTPHDLWVLTSLLAQLDTAPWFDQPLVLPPDAGTAFRNRIRDRILDRWPEVRPVHTATSSRGRGVMVDPRAGGRWMSMHGRLLSRPIPDRDVELVDRLILVSRFNEAALHLAAREVAGADAVMDDIDALLDPETDARPPWAQRRPGRRGQAVGVDGAWAEAYAEEARSKDEKLSMLRTLRSRAGSDLGPIDAEVFVREAYRGTPRSVRSLARAIVVEQFDRGPNVAAEMLDQFPDAPRTERVSETIRRLTGRLLPQARSGTWLLDARRALIMHALSLSGEGRGVIDEGAAEVSACFIRRLGLIRAHGRHRASTESAGAPHESAALLADAWQTRAQGTISRWPFPDELDGLARRREIRQRLVDGSIQIMVAEQLTVLEYLTYVTVAEQPSVLEAAGTILADAARRRREAWHVLRQAIEVEQAIAAIWALRLTVTAPEGASS